MNNRGFKKTVLPNGLRVITVPQPANLAATLLILVETGSKYEKKEINGLSHFLEHMCFKGTTKRPTVLQITSELDTIGATTNAFTSNEYTGYYAKAEARHLDKVLDILSDIYLNPVFDEKEISKERGVITEEINMYEDTPQEKIGEVFLELLYGDQPAGWGIAGTKDVVKKLTREDFIKYRGEHYLSQATTVVVAGSFDESTMIGKIETAFSRMPTGKKIGKVKTVEKQERPQLLISYKNSDQTHIALGVRAFDITDDRRFALEVLAGVLGGGMSSRLFQSVREKLGAAYYVHANADLYTDCGYLAVLSGVDKNKLPEVVSAIVDEFNILREKLVPHDELNKVKNQISSSLVLGLETSNRLANFYGIQDVIEHKIMTPQEITERINEVTAEDVRRVANDIFKNDRLNLAILGPIKDDGKLHELLKIA